MEITATQETDAPVVAPGRATEQSQATDRAPMIPIPADKWRETLRDADAFRKQSRVQASGQTPSTNNPSALEPDAEKAVGVIADAVDRRLESRFTEQDDRLDSLTFKSRLAELESDPKAKYVHDEIISEFRALSKEDTRSSRADLLEKAQSRALQKAWDNGSLIERIERETTEATLKAQLERRGTNAPAGRAASKDSGQKEYSQMSKKELASLPDDEWADYERSVLGSVPRRHY